MVALMVSRSVLLHLSPNAGFLPVLTIVPSLPEHQVYEWFILFDREVKHVWRKDWNISKVLFIISRYGLLLDMPMTFTCESGLFLTYSCDLWNAHRVLLF